ncbi:hypothetical protein MMPV_003135 [Pyropia vietnamensis]
MRRLCPPSQRLLWQRAAPAAAWPPLLAAAAVATISPLRTDVVAAAAAVVVAAAVAIAVAAAPLHRLNGGDSGTGRGGGRYVAVVAAEVAARNDRLLSATQRVSPADDVNGWSYYTRLPPGTAGMAVSPIYARRPLRRHGGSVVVAAAAVEEEEVLVDPPQVVRGARWVDVAEVAVSAGGGGVLLRSCEGGGEDWKLRVRATGAGSRGHIRGGGGGGGDSGGWRGASGAPVDAVATGAAGVSLSAARRHHKWRRVTPPTAAAVTSVAWVGDAGGVYTTADGGVWYERIWGGPAAATCDPGADGSGIGDGGDADADGRWIPAFDTPLMCPTDACEIGRVAVERAACVNGWVVAAPDAAVVYVARGGARVGPRGGWLRLLPPAIYRDGEGEQGVAWSTDHGGGDGGRGGDHVGGDEGVHCWGSLEDVVVVADWLVVRSAVGGRPRLAAGHLPSLVAAAAEGTPRGGVAAPVMGEVPLLDVPLPPAITHVSCGPFSGMTFTPPSPWHPRASSPPSPTPSGAALLSLTLSSPVCSPAPYTLRLSLGSDPTLVAVTPPHAILPGTPMPLSAADVALVAACTVPLAWASPRGGGGGVRAGHAAAGRGVGGKAAAAADVAAAAAAIGGRVVLAAASAGAVPAVGAVVRSPANWAGLLLVAPVLDLVGLVGGGSQEGSGEAIEWGTGPGVAAICPTASLPLRGHGSDGGTSLLRDTDDVDWLTARPPVHITAGAADTRVPAESIVRWVRVVAAAQARVSQPPLPAVTTTAENKSGGGAVLAPPDARPPPDGGPHGGGRHGGNHR